MSEEIKQQPLFPISDQDVKAIMKLRNWCVGLANNPPNGDNFIGTLAFRLAVDADCLGLKLTERGAVNINYALAVAATKKRKPRKKK